MLSYLEKIKIKDVLDFLNLYSEYQGKPVITFIKNKFLNNVEERKPIYAISTVFDGDYFFYGQSKEMSLIRAASLTLNIFKNFKKYHYF
ncbi:MAG: hypothetical protein LEGION0398_MBIBDBAK_01000 [Legionellaceae bacterium]